MSRNSMLSLAALLVIASFTVACSDDDSGPAMPPPLVEVITLKKETVPVNNTYVGQTEGSNAVEVRAQVSGILMKRTYKEGNHVNKGDVLFEIEPDTYNAMLGRARGAFAQTQARYTQARQTLNRILHLYKQKAVSQQDRDNAQAGFNAAKADMEAAKAAVTEAEIQLAYAYVTAPVSGFTSKAYRSIGNLISPNSADGSLLTVINTLNPMYVNFAISSPEYMEQRELVAKGRMRIPERKAELTINGIVYSMLGDITFMDTQVNPTTSVIDWRASFPNPGAELYPGQFARVRILGPELIDAIMVPQRAILQTQQGTVVIVVNEKNIAEYRPVKFSYNVGELRLMDEGLEEGDRIIIEGLNKVRPGSPVTIMPDKAKATTATSKETGTTEAASKETGTTEAASKETGTTEATSKETGTTEAKTE